MFFPINFTQIKGKKLLAISIILRRYGYNLLIQINKMSWKKIADNLQKIIFEFNSIQNKKNPFPTGILQVHFPRLEKNINILKKHACETSGKSDLKCLIPVKANAYGHGLYQVSKYLQQTKLCDYLGVAHFTQAFQLRKQGIKMPILIFGQIKNDQQAIKRLSSQNIEIEISDLQLLQSVEKIASQRNQVIKVHLSVDTGMGRTGVLPQNAPKLIKAIKQSSNVYLQGVMTHFSSSDSQVQEDIKFTRTQIEKFKTIKNIVQQQFGRSPLFHTSNSGGVVFHKQSIFDMIRPGIATYGYNKLTQPVMDLVTNLTLVKDFPVDHPIGYSRHFICTQEYSRIGIIPIGYGDGLPRILSNKASFIVNGVKYKLAGNISMDQCSIVIGPNDKVGADIVLIGKRGNQSVDAQELAKIAGTISYQIICSLGNAKRLRHQYFL